MAPTVAIFFFFSFGWGDIVRLIGYGLQTIVLISAFQYWSSVPVCGHLHMCVTGVSDVTSV